MLKVGVQTSLLLALLLNVGSAWAGNAFTAIFTDSQFTASPYGIAVARQCLNPNNSALRDASAVRIFANPGGHTGHLLTNSSLPRLGSGQSHVWTYQGTQNGVSARTQTNQSHPKTYFDQQMNDSQVNRIMIFMGINEVDSRNQNWKTLADQIQRSGKECFVSLPPLVNSESWNRRIIQYNRHVQEVLSSTSCRIIDPSNTLTTTTTDDLRFSTADGVHFASSAADSVARATCDALAEATSTSSPVSPVAPTHTAPAPTRESFPFLEDSHP